MQKMIRNYLNTSLRYFSRSIHCTMYEERTSIENFAFIDLETTGIPSMENNKTKITELSITVIESNHLRSGVYPRVRNKLHLCFNPRKFISPDATKITGLSNDLLENQSSFSLEIVKAMNEFLNVQKKPICFVAHNGNQFDYPILRAEISKAHGELATDILCIDSLLCFRNLHENQNSLINKPDISKTESEGVTSCETASKRIKVSEELPLEFTDDFDQILCEALDEYEESNKMKNIQKKNETTPVKQIKLRKGFNIDGARKFSTKIIKHRPRVSFKLESIYERLFGKTPENTHHAEGDVDSMIHCAAKYGQDFITWANNNAKLFAEIPPMRPGIKINS